MNAAPRYQVRALSRALDILRVLNGYKGLNASELSRLVALPRPTVLRLLMTLDELGYVERSDGDGCFRVATKVAELSRGYVEEPWLAIARPMLTELSQELVWPLALLRLRDNALIVEAVTDSHSKMLVRRQAPGTAIPLLSSSSGDLFLALADEAERQALLEQAGAESEATLSRIDMNHDDVARLIDAARRNGFAELHLPTHSAISVPVRVSGDTVCALNMRMHALPESRQAQLGSYVPMLKDAARRLEKRLAS